MKPGITIRFVGIDHRGVAGGDVGTHRTDLAVLDQHVGFGEVADRAVEREHDAALEQDAARALHAREVGIALRRGAAGECAGGGKRQRRRREWRAGSERIPWSLMVSPPSSTSEVRRYGLPISRAPSPARIGSGNDTAARSHTKRGAIMWISQLSSRWMV